MVCDKCGQKLPKTALFCYICGTEIDCSVPDEDTATKGTKCGKPKARGNGTGTAYKRGNTWTCAVVLGYDESGKPMRRTKGGFKTKKEALEYVPMLRNEGILPDRKTTLQSLWEEYKQGRYLKVSHNQQVHYNKAWDRLKPLHGQDIKNLRVGDFQYLINNQTETFYQAKYIKDLLSLLYQVAIGNGVVQSNIASYIELPNHEEKETEAYETDDIKTLWEDYYKGNEFTGLYLLMIYTGMMPGEVRNLRVGNIDTKNKKITGIGLKTEKRKETPIVVPDIIIGVLNNIIKNKDENDKVYDGSKATFYRNFHVMQQRTGIRGELKPYSCRHTTATTLANANISAPIIKEVMRHAKITTTQRYIHLDQTAEHEAVNEVFTQKTDKTE